VSPNKDLIFHEKQSFEMLLAYQKELVPLSEAVVRTYSGAQFAGLGSAFWVSPTILATANHCVDGDVLVLPGEVYAPSHKNFFPQQKFKATPLISHDELKKIIEQHESEYFDLALASKGIRRNLAQADFQFLQVENYVYKGPFLRPYSGKIQTDQRICLVGYPAKPKLDWCTKYSVSFDELSSSFGDAWYTRTFSPGSILAAGPRVLCHTATSLKGCSGGPLVVLPPNPRPKEEGEDWPSAVPFPFEFCGIHTEGWVDTNHNIAISTLDPSWITMYIKHVVPTLPK